MKNLLLIKGVSETTKDKAKEQKGRFLSMVLAPLGSSLLGNLLTEKGAIRISKGTTGEITIRAS